MLLTKERRKWQNDDFLNGNVQPVPSGIAIFELQAPKPTNRTHPDTGNRQSAVAAAAYRAGENLTDAQTEQTHFYSKRTGVEHSEIIAPANAPAWVYDRSELWNRHEAQERQHNSQIFREVRVALPKAFGTAENVDMTRQWVQENFVSRGMVADVSFHDMSPEDTNPHAHIMLTMRHLEAEGFGNKNREWNNYSPVLKLSKAFRDEHDIEFVSAVAQWRASWSLHVNEHLEAEGIEARISHLSKAEFKKQQDRETLTTMQAETAKWWNEKHHSAIDKARINAAQNGKIAAIEPEHIALSAFHMEKRGIDTTAAENKEGVEVRNGARVQSYKHLNQLKEHFEVKDQNEMAHQLNNYYAEIAEWWNDAHSIDHSDDFELEWDG